MPGSSDLLQREGCKYYGKRGGFPADTALMVNRLRYQIVGVMGLIRSLIKAFPILGGHTIYCGSYIFRETCDTSNIHQVANGSGQVDI